MSLRDVINEAYRQRKWTRRTKGIVFECEVTNEDCYECKCEACEEWRETLREKIRKDREEERARRDEYSDRIIRDQNRRKS